MCTQYSKVPARCRVKVALCHIWFASWVHVNTSMCMHHAPPSVYLETWVNKTMTKNCNGKGANLQVIFYNKQLHPIAAAVSALSVNWTLVNKKGSLICFPILSSPLEVILNLPRTMMVHKIVNSYSRQYSTPVIWKLSGKTGPNSGQRHSLHWPDEWQRRQDMSIEL